MPHSAKRAPRGLSTLGFFAVLDEPAGTEYDVLRAHVNVWSLRGLLGHRPMIFDVGLLIRPRTELARVLVALPVKAGGHQPPYDLAPAVGRSRVAKLIFDRAYVNANEDELRLTYYDEPIRILRLDDASGIEDESDDTLTIIALQFARPLAAEELGYVRARIPCDDGGLMWRWNRSLLRRNGALIDFRAPDVRETGAPHERPALEGRAKDLGTLDVFILTAEKYQLQAANPLLKYTRTLEGAAWEPYLRRAPRAWSREKILAHSWHDDDVTTQRPFRGYLQLNRVPGFRAPSDLLLSGLVAALVIWALLEPTAIRDWLADAGSGVADAAGWLGVALVAALGLTSLSAIFDLPQRIRWLGSAVTKTKRWLKRREYAFFRMLRKKD